MNLERFIDDFRRNSDRAGFVLDFDGTLSQVVMRPGQASALPGAKETLELLAAAYAVVALLSGRRAEDLHDIVLAENVRYFGVYGGEEYEGGRLIQVAEADRWRGMASRLARDAEALIHSEGLEGAEVEYKDIAVSVHYRRARDEAGEVIRQWASVAGPKRGFRANAGRKVVEITPEGVSKAEALEKTVSAQQLEMVVAAGDDWSDVEALERAGSLLSEKALRIGVASNEQPAHLKESSDIVADSPSEVLELLQRFL